jgi:hypothetical protein
VSADYAIVNIKDLEDQAVKFGLSPNLEGDAKIIETFWENAG